MPEAGQALYLGDERPGEQAMRRQFAVPVDVVEDELVVRGGAVAPVQDLLPGELLEDELLVVVDVGELRLHSGDDGGGRARRGHRDRSHRRGRDVVGRLRYRGFGAVGLGGGLTGVDLLPLVLAGPTLGGHPLVQLPVGGRAALVLGGTGHRGVHGGRDRVALGAAVGMPVLASRAVPAGVEQHPVVAPGIAALLTLGQAPGQQPAHRVGDRTAGAQLLVQAPHKPVGEHLGSVRTARKALHPLELTAGGGLHQAAGSRTVATRPDQVDRRQDGSQILRRQRHPPPLLPALTDELDLAEQLLANLDLRATTINAAIAALIRDAGSPTLEDRLRALRTELDTAGLTSMTPTLELAAAFHHAVLDNHAALTVTISHLRELTQDGNFAYYADIAHFMGSIPTPAGVASPTRWIDGEQTTRARWRSLLDSRRALRALG